MRVAALVVSGLALTAPSAGQTLYTGGIKMAAAFPGVSVLAIITDAGNTRCNVSKGVVEAEAERALRRDGVAVVGPGDTLATVVAEVVVLESIVGGRFAGCVASVMVYLQVTLDPEPEQRAVVLGALYTNLLVGPQQAHGRRVRESVEEAVSVVANRSGGSGTGRSSARSTGCTSGSRGREAGARVAGYEPRGGNSRALASLEGLHSVDRGSRHALA